MALKATIFKAALQVADMDRNHYADYSLMLARHPSETDARMMVRLLAFACHASESLEFGRGLSTDDEPDIWQKTLSDEIELWIDLGQPDEKRVRKACNRADQVWIYTYQPRAANVWLEQNSATLARFDNLNVVGLDAESVEELAGLAQRNMQLQCTIQDGLVWFGDDARSVSLQPERRLTAGQ
jgi:uncharacterized protein YaeQ